MNLKRSFDTWRFFSLSLCVFFSASDDFVQQRSTLFHCRYIVVPSHSVSRNFLRLFSLSLPFSPSLFFSYGTYFLFDVSPNSNDDSSLVGCASAKTSPSRLMEHSTSRRTSMKFENDDLFFKEIYFSLGNLRLDSSNYPQRPSLVVPISDI